MKQTVDKLTPTREERKLLVRLLDSTETSDVDANLLVTAFARIVWSRLIEPGDSVAYLLTTALGPGCALELLIAGASAKEISARLAEQEASDVVAPGIREIAAGLKRWGSRLERKETQQDMRTIAEIGGGIVLPESEEWPEQLDDLQEFAPLMLWTRGNRELLKSGGLAIVGARASTAYGEQITTEFAATAIHHQISIISGAAYGIDAVAHRTALASAGSTVAVLAGGVDRAYPAGHTELLKRITQEGVICAESAPGFAPTRWRFLQRNRLIAALSQATLVTEAGNRSGSLNTAGHASQLGRPLGAVPGPITSVSSMGTHRLLKEYDAQIITDENDLRELLGIHADLITGVSEAEPRQLSSHQRVLDAIPLKRTQSIANISKQSGFGESEALNILVELELLGAVECVAGRGTPDSKWKFSRGRM